MIIFDFSCVIDGLPSDDSCNKNHARNKCAELQENPACRGQIIRNKTKSVLSLMGKDSAQHYTVSSL